RLEMVLQELRVGNAEGRYKVDLCEPGIDLTDLGLLGNDLLGDPGLAVVVIEEDLEQRVDRRNVRPIKQRHHHRACEGKGEPDPIGPGVSHEAGEILHVWRAPKKCDPKASLPSPDRLERPGSRVWRVYHNGKSRAMRLGRAVSFSSWY